MDQLKEIRWTIAAAAAVDVATGSALWAVGAGLVIEFSHRVERLTPDEQTIWNVLASSMPGSVYGSWVTTSQILDTLPNDFPRKRAQEILLGMRAKGLLYEAAGYWQAVR